MYEKYEVRVCAEDLGALKSHCEAIGRILECYPSSNGPSNNFITAMMRVKNHYGNLRGWVNLLNVK